jgi:hypothetical protein
MVYKPTKEERVVCNVLRNKLLETCSAADTDCHVVVQALMDALMEAIAVSVRASACDAAMLDAVIHCMRDIANDHRKLAHVDRVNH